MAREVSLVSYAREEEMAGSVNLIRCRPWVDELLNILLQFNLYGGGIRLSGFFVRLPHTPSFDPKVATLPRRRVDLISKRSGLSFICHWQRRSASFSHCRAPVREQVGVRARVPILIGRYSVDWVLTCG